VIERLRRWWILKRTGWHVGAQMRLPCGCYVRADVKISHGVTPEQALEHYASMFAIGCHTSAHRALCKRLPRSPEPFFINAPGGFAAGFFGDAT
jgi:hypothetical protein